MDDLDFSELTDDQIVELAVLLAREAMRRNPALSAAFEQALVDEADRVAAAAAGAEKARAAAKREIEEQARRAELEVQRELLARRTRAALERYLRRGAEIAGRSAEDVTLVWRPNEWGRGGPRLLLNAGTAGELANWHLVKYVVHGEALHTSPGLRGQSAALHAWAREVCAAIRALNIDQTIVIKGIDL